MRIFPLLRDISLFLLFLPQAHPAIPIFKILSWSLSMRLFRFIVLAIALFMWFTPLHAQESDTVPTVAMQAVSPLINLNQASVKELTAMKGMSLAKAKAILSYRKRHGEFKTLAELRQVKGFAKMKAAKFNAFIQQLKLTD